ncbi:abnormal spindle-like microcephaly-associated-like protein [Plakobranchus ocellatus]|uniref:Abnormal spindle-like microcephaly-associated-like protein n=1 Tax=Plakobranchus ocellatus TaxID=259542 RepID=A0AAV4DNN4_9GAST|nr:abnormal spindle-like microcephaly-associated-like protein [Plakobranchus ocellatus]
MASNEMHEGRRSRRSWFDAPPLTNLNSPANLEPKQPNRLPAPKKRSLESVENLTLTHFTAPPRIGFGNVILGRSKTRTLLIRNPHDYEQEVIVERFPYKKKFSIEATRFTVQPNEVFSLEISWSPEETGGVREMIQFHINDVYRLQAFLFGSADKPKQPSRRGKKNGLGPRMRQQPSVLQTPALTSIKSSYSPRRSEEALDRIEEANLLEQERDKENSGTGRSGENKYMLAETQQSTVKKSGAPVKEEVLRPNEKITFLEHKIASTPTPLESTTIIPKQEKETMSSDQRNRKQWRGITDGTSAILNTMSPIPLSEGNEHGITVDSYYQPNDTRTDTFQKLTRNGELGETFAKPQLPLNAARNMVIDRRATTTLPSSAFTSKVGQLLHPDLPMDTSGIPKKDESSTTIKSTMQGDATYGVLKSAVSRASLMPEMTFTPEARHTPPKAFCRAGESPPRTPSVPQEKECGALTQASPNTMLNESLSLISRMKVSNHNISLTAVNESGSSSTNDGNASLSCSIISQGVGMVSPNSFMEDMRNASMNLSQRVHGEITNTSTPNLPGSMDAQAKALCGTPGKPRPPSARFVPKRRSITTQYQREQEKRVAAAAKMVKHDNDALRPATTSPRKIGLLCELKAMKQGKRRALEDPSLCSVTSKEKRFAHSKRSERKNKPQSKKRSPCMKHSPKRLRKEVVMKKMRNKSNGYQEKEFGSISHGEKEVLNNTTPNSKCSTVDSHTVVKSRSFESNTRTNGKLENGKDGPRYFPDIFCNDDEVDSTSIGSHTSRRQLSSALTDGENGQKHYEGVSDIELELENSESNVRVDHASGEKTEVLGQNKYGRAVASLERVVFSSPSFPMNFNSVLPADFPTSPSENLLHQDRRSTLTVTKSRPSDALLAAMNNRKRLFDEDFKQNLDTGATNEFVCKDEGNSEMEENIEVVKESYQERRDKMYVVVQETTCVKKSTTDTYIEQVTAEHANISPGQFCTPTRLPNSPDPQLSRRSTHVLHSPKVIDKFGMKAKKLEFVSGQELSEKSNLEGAGDEAVTDNANSKSKSETFEKEPTLLVDDATNHSVVKSNTFEKEASTILGPASANSTAVKSDTFEKETSVFLKSTEKELISLGSAEKVINCENPKPITAVCVMSPKLVDYDDVVSEDGGSGGDITRDSLEATTQSEDSLDKSSACKITRQIQQANYVEQPSAEHASTVDMKETRVADFVNAEACIEPPKPETSTTKPDKYCEEADSEAESEDEDQFYDTLSQRYYDALSDTVDLDLDEELDCAMKCEVVHDKFQEPEKRIEDKIVLPPARQPCGAVESSNKIHCGADSYERAIDRKEEFMVHHRQYQKQYLKPIHEEHCKAELVHQTTKDRPLREKKKKVRRSLSADQIVQPVTFSVDISDLKSKSNDKVENTKPKAVKNTCVESNFEKKNLPNLQAKTFVKPVNQPKASREKSQAILDSRQRSQSLSNLQKLKDKKGGSHTEEKMTSKATSKPRLNSGVKAKRLLKGVAQSRLILVKQPKSGAPRHPMPFAARNMYYDERWMEKQERGFVQWLNFVLTPPDEYVAATNKAKVNAGSLSLDSHQVVAQLAPTKEVLSFRAYAARRRMNRLRRQACQLYQSEAVVSVIRKVEAEVESRRIAMRKDKMAHADLGIKQRMLDLLLQYSSLWLRIGLETIYGEILMLQSNQDVLGLSRFIVTRLLSSPDIAAEFAHPTVPHLYKEGYAAAVSRHTVKKFLLLVYFLDYAKTSRLIDHDPCLFCKDAEIKSSKEILVQFSREVLSGEGDITRHLAYLGYTVSQSQRPIDEFDFAVKNLSADLRDGLRLCRVMELLAGEQGIMGRLRTPAISRLQKIHNMEECFRTAQVHGLDLSASGVTARDVVDGHREKTLSLLWRVIMHFQSCIQVNESELQEEIHLLSRSLQLKLAMQKIGAMSIADCKACFHLSSSTASRDSGAGDTKLLTENVRLQLIFQWCRLVCLHYGVKVENFTVSFSDGRALCCLLHHYHPALLPLNMVKFQTTISVQEAATEWEEREQRARKGGAGAGINDSDISMDWTLPSGKLLPENDPEVFEQLLVNEKSNFKTLFEKVSALGGVPLMLKSADMCNTIPDEKVVSTYVSYLCARLLDIRQEVRAARLIQMAWRRHLLRRALRERQKQIAAAVKLQRWIRPILTHRRYVKQERAAIVIQASVRCYLARQTVSKLKEARLQQELRSQQERSALVLQKLWRGHQARLHCQRLRVDKERERVELMQTQAATTLQRVFRGWQARKESSRQRSAAHILQAAWRSRQAKKVLEKLREDRQMQAATVLASAVKGFLLRRQFLKMKKASLVFQKNWRRIEAKKELEMLKHERDERLAKLKFEQEMKAAILIQSVVRSFLCRKNFLRLKCSCIVLQSCWRRYQAVKELSALKVERDTKAAVMISKQMRRFFARQKFLALKQAAIVVQSYWRMYAAQRELVRLRELHKEASALVIQKVIKGALQRKKYQRLKHASVVLQNAWRSKKAHQELETLREQRQREASVVIQKNLRAYAARQRFLMLKSSVLRLQKNWRKVLARREAEKKRQERKERAAIVLQKHYRGFGVRSEFVRMKLAVVVMQKFWRRTQAKRKVAYLRLQKQTHAAVLIQSLWRGWYIKQDYTRMKAAAICIQASWRMWSARHLFIRNKSAALIIQSWCRAVMEARRQRQAYLRLRQAAVYCQTAWRGKTQREKFLRTKKAAVIIQSNFRGFRRRLKFLAVRLACVIVQRRYRALLEGRKQRADYRRKIQAVLCIQRFVRGIQTHRHIRHTAAALLLQTAWRKTQAEKSFRRQKAAALVIQKRYREYCHGKYCRESYVKTKSAVITIQHAYRDFLHKKKHAKFIECVTRLQAYARGKQARQDFVKKQTAILIIQRKVRANKMGRIFRQAFLLIRTSAIKIQRFYRAVQERRKVLRELFIQKQAVTKIQAVYRGWKLRKDFLTQRRVAIILQQRYRAMKAGKKTRAKYEEMKWAVDILQSWWRRYMEIREAKRLLEKMREAAQTERIRRWEAEKLEEQRREEEQRLWLEREAEKRRWELEQWVEQRRRERAARILQRSWRGYLVMQDYVTRENAAVLIQTHVRGFLARMAYSQTLASIILLQRMMRGWVYRRRFEVAKFAATIIQQRWRAVLEARRQQQFYLNLRDTVVKLQSFVRMKFQRESFLCQVNSVIFVQAQVRMYIQRKNFSHMKKNVLVLQRTIKAYQAMKRDRAVFLNMKSSAIKIQSVVRLWLAYRHVQREKSALKIQTYWRMYQERVAFSEAYKAAEVLQTFMLMKHQQLEQQARHTAAVTIQRAFKSFLSRKEVKRYEAACTIQNWFRNSRIRGVERKNNAAVIIVRTLRRLMLHKKMLRFRAVVVLQSAVRMYLERRQYLRLHRSTIVLQAALRGHRAREMVKTLRAQHQAATLVQAFVRGFLVRKKMTPVLQEKLKAAQEHKVLQTASTKIQPVLQEKLKAAQEHKVLQTASTKIQAAWRGYLVRRDTKSKKLVQARRRLEELNRSATESQTLRSRTASALDYLLREKDLAYILESLMHLETATRLSPECCERMVEVNAVGVLYRLINSCNRSLPHMDLIKYSISILLNLAKYEKTIEYVMEPQESVGTLLELMQIYREKGILFYRSCMLLGILGMAPRMRAHILSYPGITERLQSIHALVLRKQKAAQTRKTALDKMAAMRTSYNCTLPVLTPLKSKRQPKVRPCWSVARDAMKDFEDPSTAIHFVLNSLQIGPKTKF